MVGTYCLVDARTTALVAGHQHCAGHGLSLDAVEEWLT
jgi:hypothetical protein